MDNAVIKTIFSILVIFSANLFAMEQPGAPVPMQLAQDQITIHLANDQDISIDKDQFFNLV